MALACGYFLRRTGLHFVLLDDQERSGGVWLHAWDSLTLFSPAEYSSLLGWLMPASQGKFPSKVWLVGYGSWTGFASATLIGVGRSARQTVNEVVEYLQNAAVS